MCALKAQHLQMPFRVQRRSWLDRPFKAGTVVKLALLSEKNKSRLNGDCVFITNKYLTDNKPICV